MSWLALPSLKNVSKKNVAELFVVSPTTSKIENDYPFCSRTHVTILSYFEGVAFQPFKTRLGRREVDQKSSKSASNVHNL